jgi:hypothetical protein
VVLETSPSEQRGASNDHQEWMMSLENSGPAAGEARSLSWRQKRELVELVAAGVMSAVFFTAPVFLVRDTLGRRRPAPIAATAPPPRAPIPPAPLATVQVLTTDVAVPVSIPALVATPRVVRAVRWTAPPRPSREAPAAAPRLTLGRRIARLFAGNGSHTVQPFPSIPTTNR